MEQSRPRILLTGRNGQVGSELERTLPVMGEVFAFGRKEMDLSKPDEVREAVARVKPDIIVNPAAYTMVDNAEKEPDLAMAVNGIAPGILAEEARRYNALMVHFSSDYVFDGKKGEPYTEEDEPNPLNVYGKTKLAGDIAVQEAWNRHLIIRSSWIYGTSGSNFLLSILELAREKKEIRVVEDQVGSPTWSRTLARVSQKMMLNPFLLQCDPPCDFFGVYHVCSTGSTSRFGFAKAILSSLPEKHSLPGQLISIRSAEYPALARRPGYSVLDTGKTRRSFGLKMPLWDEDLALVMEGIYAKH